MAKKTEQEKTFVNSPCEICPQQAKNALGATCSMRVEDRNDPRGFSWKSAPNRPLPALKQHGVVKSDVVIVGDSPYPQDVCNGMIFSDTRRKIEDTFRRNGVDVTNYIFTSSVKCNVNKKGSTTGEIRDTLSACRHILVNEINAASPKLIIAFGDFALKQILKAGGISKKRGTLIFSKEFNCWVYPAIHPVIVNIDQSKASFWDADITQVCQFIKNGYKAVTVEDTGSYSDVESIDFILKDSNFATAPDTETQGKDWADPNGLVISYSLTDKDGRGYNVWLHHEVETEAEADFTIQWERKNGKRREVVPVYVKRADGYERKVAELRELLTRSDITKIMMNGNFDLHRFRTLGIEREEVKKYTFDIQTGMHVIDPDNFKQASMLDIQRAVLPGSLDHKTAFAAEDGDKKDMLLSAKTDPVAFTNYAAADSARTHQMGIIIRQAVANDPFRARYYTLLQHPVQSEIMYEMEKNGILFDTASLPEAKDKIAKVMMEKEREFLAKVPAAVLDKHRQKGIKLTRNDFIRDIFFSQEGFRLTPLEKTPTGEAGIGRKLLIRLRDELPDNSLAKEALSTYIEWGPYQKLYSTYLKGFGEAVCADGKLHPSISKVGTATSRSSCVRKGSLVEIVRDVSKYPKGVPIELVRPGDLVYSFDSNGDPLLKKVTWAGKTGHRELVRIHLRNTKGLDRGYLDVTPEHRIRLSTGEYVEAQHLKPLMSVCSVYRSLSNYGYEEVWMTNKAHTAEHRFVYESVIGAIPDGCVIHHKDRNKRNNTPENLEAIPVGDHTKTHAKEDIYRVHSAALCRVYTRTELLKMFAKAKGRPTEMGHDFDCIKNALLTHDINWSEASKRYNRRGEFISRGRVRDTLRMPGDRALRYLGVGFSRWKELLDYYGFERPRKWANQFGAFTPHVNNHLIVSVERLTETDDVYDLTVEGTHNFVVGGISVHNCSKPNLQNIPKRNPLIQKPIRKLLIAPPGKKLVAADASQAELRFIAHESQDVEMIKVYREGRDIHSNTAEMLIRLGGRVLEELTAAEIKSFRTKAKAVNFGLAFGMFPKKFQAYARDEYGVHLTLKEAEAFRDAFFALYKGLLPWHEQKIAFARSNGFTRSLFGFTRLTPNINSTDMMKRIEDEHVAINTSIQSASNDTVLLAALLMKRRRMFDPARAQLSLFVHDELVYTVDEDYVDEFTPILLHAMENPPLKEMFGFELCVPLVAEAKTGYNLAEMQDYVRAA